MDATKNVDDRCVLCLESKRSPVSIQCGHSFCVGCLDIYKSYNKYPWAKKCPICRVIMEEPKKSLKRKHSDSNPNEEITSINFARNAQRTSSVSLPNVSVQHNNSLERFMSLAVNFFDDSPDENDTYLESYDYMDQSGPAYSPGSFSTDSEDYNDNFDDGDGDADDDDNGHDDYANDDDDEDDDDDYRYYYDDDEYYFEPPAGDYYSDDNGFDSSEVTSYVNVDDDAETYDTDRYDIDWETVIASDVIIID